jgi:uncharacterized damage-inducible protein DinB
LAEPSTSVLALYPDWDAYQELIITAISPLTPEQLASRPAPSLRTVDENCRHIIGARGRWSHMAMGIGDETFASFAQWDRPNMPERSAAALVDGMRQTWGVLRDALAQMTLANLDDTFANTHREPGEPESFTRRWILWHLIEHDVFHGGDILVILGTQGIPGLDL